MRPTNLLIIFLLIVFAVVLSCKKDHNSPSKKPVRYITEKDTFKTDVVWYADTIYVLKKAASINGKLTIRPGTIVKLETLSALTATSLFAIGTKDQPIIFTSIYDDEHGGDIDGDNGTIKPQAGDWLCIGSPDPGLQVRLEFCEFYYGGSVMCVTQLSQKIENCIFSHSNGYVSLFKYSLITMSVDPSASAISKNLFYDNIQPLCIYPGTSIDSTNTFSYKGISNQQNGIFIYAKSYTIKTQVNLQENEVPFVIQKDITIEDGGHLEFINGTIVKFLPNVKISKTLTGSSLNGDMKKVVFTSYKDDNRGGDTNGDGNATTPQNGDWEGIYEGIGWWNTNNVFYDNH
jgi:hypothetical protein